MICLIISTYLEIFFEITCKLNGNSSWNYSIERLSIMWQSVCSRWKVGGEIAFTIWEKFRKSLGSWHLWEWTVKYANQIKLSGFQDESKSPFCSLFNFNDHFNKSLLENWIIICFYDFFLLVSLEKDLNITKLHNNDTKDEKEMKNVLIEYIIIVALESDNTDERHQWHKLHLLMWGGGSRWDLFRWI